MQEVGEVRVKRAFNNYIYKGENRCLTEYFLALYPSIFAAASGKSAAAPEKSAAASGKSAAAPGKSVAPPFTTPL